MNPSNEADMQADRYTISYFGSPDSGTMLECVDGSNKYPPIEASEYNLQQYKKIQSYWNNSNFIYKTDLFVIFNHFLSPYMSLYENIMTALRLL